VLFYYFLLFFIIFFIIFYYFTDSLVMSLLALGLELKAIISDSSEDGSVAEVAGPRSSKLEKVEPAFCYPLGGLVYAGYWVYRAIKLGIEKGGSGNDTLRPGAGFPEGKGELMAFLSSEALETLCPQKAELIKYVLMGALITTYAIRGRSDND
jgi:hypothetical protein